VYVACRRTSPELDQLDVEVLEGVDVSDDASVAGLRERVGEEGLDVLICNAGMNNDSPGLDDIVVDDLAVAIDVNALGAVRTVLALLPSMREGSKIMLVSSMGVLPLGILGARTTGNYGYRMSKAALVSFGLALAHDVRDRGIAVAITSPGRVDTDMLRNVYAEGRTTKKAIETARGIDEVGRLFRDRMDELTLEASPSFQRDPEGAPAIPAEALKLLQEANSTQFGQASEMAAGVR
jgi:NAD(P)-dependent dehydrogenase (short-subunit alcohol dehydrogenase family)